MPMGFTLVFVFPIAGRLSARLSSELLIGAGFARLSKEAGYQAGIASDWPFWNLH
jgi:hypothetical protein